LKMTSGLSRIASEILGLIDNFGRLGIPPKAKSAAHPVINRPDDSLRSSDLSPTAPLKWTPNLGPVD
jgi:hypothetical protein